jgi:large subunit ribosomal protein L23
MTIYKILLKPLSTEKTNKMADRYNRIAFKVATWANKMQVKQAVEKLFNVSVQQVNIINMYGKTRTFKQRIGKRSDWKKAIIKLPLGQDIKIAEFIKLG